jgi:hypothetical protein
MGAVFHDIKIIDWKQAVGLGLVGLEVKLVCIHVQNIVLDLKTILLMAMNNKPESIHPMYVLILDQFEVTPGMSVIDECLENDHMPIPIVIIEGCGGEPAYIDGHGCERLLSDLKGYSLYLGPGIAPLALKKGL